jgi:hypothetical protein
MDMIELTRARTVKFAPSPGSATSVRQEELAAIAERRAAAGIHNHNDFADLDATVTESITQRHLAPPFQEVLRQLNDETQTAAWREHAAQVGEPAAANLTGLAFSGGGIRSATFNLGVLQVLAWTGVLKFVDYLSTVSGGGYLGSCLSSWCGSSTKAQPQPFPFEHQPGKLEAPVFRHLRNNAEYLAPSGAVDYLRIPMTVVRGMVINLLVILPYLLFAALLTKLVHPDVASLDRDWILEHSSWVPTILGRHFIFTKVLLLLMLVSFVAFPVVYLFLQETKWVDLSNWQVRNHAGRIYAAMLLVIGAVAFIEVQPIVLRWLLVERKVAIQQWAAAITTAQSLLPVTLSAWLLKNTGKLLGKYVLSLLGLSALLAFWLIELAIATHLIEGSQYSLSWSGLWAPVAMMLVLFVYGLMFVDMNYTSVHAFYRDRLSKAYLIKPGASDTQAPQANDKQRLSALNTRHCPYHLLNTAINLNNTPEAYRRGRHADSFIFSPRFVGSELTGYCRTRDMESQTRHLNLGTAMAISGAAAAPNMGKQTNRLLAFFLAMLNVRLNYWLPNPRYAVPRPHRVLPRNPLRRVGPLYLLRELFGALSADSFNVNLSDGGHFDNMGLYELLRRQCRFIICGDGEADPHLQFNGLADAIRMAQVDFGILVHMQGLDALRAGKQHYAIGRIRYADHREGWLLYLKQCMLADDSLIATLGEMRFMSSKDRNDCASFDRGVFIAEYKARYPDFPHQSTGDQFFDEAQFECTRAQGYNVAYRTLCI